MKHFDANGYELCSGREGWANRKTTDAKLVTCKNCLRALEKEKSQRDATLARSAAQDRASGSL